MRCCLGCSLPPLTQTGISGTTSPTWFNWEMPSLRPRRDTARVILASADGRVLLFLSWATFSA